jgi:hypothetical protein
VLAASGIGDDAPTELGCADEPQASIDEKRSEAGTK